MGQRFALLGRSCGSAWAIAIAGLAGILAISGRPTKAHAQENPPAASNRLAVPAQVPPLLNQHAVVPDAVYLLDERGNRVLVPDFTFERWSQLERAVTGNRTIAAGDLPALADQTLFIRGTVDGLWADLEVTLTGQLPTVDAGTSLSLRMDNFFQDGPSEIAGVDGGRCELAADGYRLRFPAGPPVAVEFRGRFAARVGQLNGSPLLEFRLPVARTTIELTVPQTGIQGAVVGRGTEQLETESLPDSQTLIRVRGSGGDLRVQWQQGSWNLDRAALIDVRSTWSVEWAEPDRPPRASVQLALQNQLGRLGSVELTLPLQSTIAPVTLASQSWRAQRLAEGSSTTGERWRFERLGESEERSAELPLELQWSRAEFSADDPLILGGLSVEGAIRQPGTINIKVPADTQLRWRQASSLRTVERSDSQTFRFAYEQTPFELAAWLVADQRRLQITPRYSITAAPVATTLLCELSGVASGPAAGTLQLSLNGWQLLNVVRQPDERPFEGFEFRDGVLRLDLAALTGDLAGESRFQLSITAMRPRATGEERLQLTVPTLAPIPAEGPAFVAVDDAVLELAPIEGWQVVPDTSRLLESGLRAEPNRDDRLVYRVPAGRNVDFDGLLRRVEVRAVANLDMELRIDPTVTSVTQRWGLRVEQGVVTSPQFVMLGDSDGIAGWTAEVDGRNEFVEVVGAGPRRSLTLPAARMSRGDHTVVLRWELDKTLNPEGSPSEAHPWQTLRLPFAQLRVAAPIQLADISGEILPPEGWEARWRVAERSANALPAAEPQLESEGVAVEVRQLTEELPSTSLLVERAWLQTVLGRSQQRERIVLNIRGNGTYLLRTRNWPPETNYRVAIDRRIVREGTQATEVLPIELQGGTTDRLHVVEVWAWMPRTAAGEQVLRVARPRITSLTGARQIYWQVIAPPDEHLLWSPAGLARAMQWQWRAGLKRVPVMDDAALCRWTGCEPEQPAPAGNRYLFSASTSSDMEAMTIPRVWLWLTVALPAFLALAAVTAWPSLRRPLALTGMAALLVGLATVAPDAAVLLGQLFAAIALPIALMVVVRRLVLYWQSTRLVRAFARSVPIEPTGSSRQRPTDSLRPTDAIRPTEVLRPLEGSSRRITEPTAPLIRGDVP